MVGQGNSSFRTELGVQADRTLHVGSWAVQGFARVAWAHYATRDASMGLGFASLPGAGFTIRGARPEAHAVLIAVGLDTRIVPCMTLGARLDSEVFGSVRTV